MTTVHHAGSAPLNPKWLLTITDPGVTVVFANATDVGEPPLVLADCSSYSELVVDGEARTVLADDVATPGLVQAGSGWPMLLPGDNSVTVTGGTGTLRHYRLDL